MARCIKQNHAAQRHCEKQSVSPAVRASVGMFFRGPHSAYEVVPCERERYSFPPQGTAFSSTGSPFAWTNFWQWGKRGRTASLLLLTLSLLRAPLLFTLAAEEDDEPGERSHHLITIPYPDNTHKGADPIIDFPDDSAAGHCSSMHPACFDSPATVC